MRSYSNSKSLFYLSLIGLSMFFCSSCSIFQPKYIEVYGESGKCWTDHYVSITNNITERNDHRVFAEIEFIVFENTPKDANVSSMDHLGFEMKLQSQEIDYDLKFGFDPNTKAFVRPGTYKLDMGSRYPGSGYEFHYDFEPIELKSGEKKTITLGISISEPCESYIIKEVMLRSEWKKIHKKKRGD